jgi:acid phosphatase (class A)
MAEFPQPKKMNSKIGTVSHSFHRGLVFVLLSLVLAATPLRAVDEQLHFLPAGKPDVVALLAPPPLPDSPEQAADLAEVQAVFHAAFSNDVAVAFSEKKFSVFNFTPAIGTFFQSNNLPKTTVFFERVQKDAAAVTDDAKAYYKRPRPFTVDPSLALGKLEKNFGYPSGHSAESMVLALVLADLFPDKHDAIIVEARAIGWHRVEIARHYPTDIYAGHVLAQAIVREMKASPDFQRDFAEVKAELAAAQNNLSVISQ